MKTKIIETKIEGADPFQPIEYIEITKNMVGFRLKFIWPKPKPVKKWWNIFK